VVPAAGNASEHIESRMRIPPVERVQIRKRTPQAVTNQKLGDINAGKKVTFAERGSNQPIHCNKY
jgi:hypothetical protein